MREKVEIIAEVGSNHGFDLDLARKYIVTAEKQGADVVKFQSIRKEKLFSQKILKDGKVVDNPIWSQVSNLDFPEEWHQKLKKCADDVEIEFMSTPFYLEAVDVLETVGVKRYKIASGDVTFVPLLEKVGRTGKPVILSTGACSIGDVENALQILNATGVGEIILLHCVVSYPPQWEEMNLKAIATLKTEFGLPVGISDHSPGSLVPIAAVAIGASVIEKHVTFDRLLPGPDHPFAMTMNEFGDMVQQVRLLEQALGTGEKVPTEDELNRQHRMRRGVYDPNTLKPTAGSTGIWLRPEHSKL